jgi:exopolyphosphatase/guanosine-5'-triphosphate,3'-diphosphate pyrophosphatase
MPVAAIDCGTNSTRLLVMDEQHNTLARQMKITGLGRGLVGSLTLSKEAIERTIDIIKKYKDTAEKLDVYRIKCFGTAAVREAINQEEFLSKVFSETGLEVSVLSPRDEAKYSFTGAISDLDENTKLTGVVDIGGGSTEIMFAKTVEELRGVSLNFGCVKLTDKFFHHDPPSFDEIESLYAYLNSLFDILKVRLKDAEVDRLVGLAGTVASLVQLEYKIPVYSKQACHHKSLSLVSVKHWVEKLKNTPSSLRLTWTGIEPGRETVLLAGSIVLETVMRSFGTDTCIYSESDILDGVCFELLS